MLVKKRHPLSSRDLKELFEETAKVVPALLAQVDRKRGVELVELEDGGRIYMQGGKPILISDGGKLMPALSASEDVLNTLPKVVVDMGAVPFVTNGADVMAPGIRKVDEGAKVGDVVLVVDEKHSKGLAVGVLLMEREEVLKRPKGKAVKNVHHVGDEIWKGMRAL